MECERAVVTVRKPDAKPTPRQVYALAHELAKRVGADASKLIEQLRTEQAKC